MQHITFWFGVALVIAGCVMYVYMKESTAENGVEFFGMRFRLSHPTLVIIVLGFVLVVRGSPDLPQDDRPGQPAPAKPPDTSIASTTKPNTTAATPGGNTTHATEQTTPAERPKDSTAMTTEPVTTTRPPVSEPAPEPPAPVKKAPVPPAPAWVYLGAAEGNSLSSQTFNLQQFPVPGQEIEALTLVNKRATAPILREDNQWYFGRVVGALKAGEHVSIRRLTTVKMAQDEPAYIWAEVDVISKTAQ